jgi:hypothetical protein
MLSPFPLLIMCEGEAGVRSIRKPAERRIHGAEEEKIAQFLVHPKERVRRSNSAEAPI